MSGRAGRRRGRWVVTLTVLLIFSCVTGAIARPKSHCKQGDICSVSVGVQLSTRFGSFVKARSSDPIVTGNAGEDAVLNLESEVGRKLSIDHVYYHFDQAWPGPRQVWDEQDGREPLINWSPDPTYTWADVAAGAADGVIDDRARDAKTFGSQVLLSFSHEPEIDVGMGTPADYVAAWRHVVSRFRQDGAANVRFVLILMATTYNQGRAAQWFPGTDYIDIIGGDGYNWYGTQVGQPWRDVKDIFSLANQWAIAQGRPFMIAETGSLEDPADPSRKANWFRSAVDWLATQPNITALVYFNAAPRYPWWADSSPASLDAYRALGQAVS
jgi:Glycosyl hydrolase family 26